VRGTATGRLYGAPATKRSFEATFFDYVQFDEGLIVGRIQQTDVLGQMRQLYRKTMGLVGAWVMLWRLQVAHWNTGNQKNVRYGTSQTSRS
jgi:hypothetical protein